MSCCAKQQLLSYCAVLEESAKGGRYRLDGGGAADEWQEGMEGKGGGENGAFGQVGKAEGAWVYVGTGRGETGEERGAGGWGVGM